MEITCQNAIVVMLERAVRPENTADQALMYTQAASNIANVYACWSANTATVPKTK